MRLAIETTSLSRPGSDRGLGRYAKAVLSAPVLEEFDVVTVSLRQRRGRTAEFRDLFERELHLWRHRPEIFHATSPTAAAITTRARTVVSVLDVIPLDVSGYSRTGLKNRLIFSLAARADCILTLSSFSASRIADRLGVDRQLIVVAPLPPAPAFRPRAAAEIADVRGRLSLIGRYVVALADLRYRDPRKRSEWLPEIGRRLSAEGAHLVVAGPGTEAWDGRDGLQGVGRLGDDDLAALYSDAACYVGTSAYEGQGLPALEAMACATPVVAMKNSAIPEIVGDGGLLIAESDPGRHSPVDHGAVSRLVQGCAQMLADDAARSEFSAAARRSAMAFTGRRFSDGLARAYGVARSATTANQHPDDRPQPEPIHGPDDCQPDPDSR